MCVPCPRRPEAGERAHPRHPLAIRRVGYAAPAGPVANRANGQRRFRASPGRDGLARSRGSDEEGPLRAVKCRQKPRRRQFSRRVDWVMNSVEWDRPWFRGELRSYVRSDPVRIAAADFIRHQMSRNSGRKTRPAVVLAADDHPEIGGHVDVVVRTPLPMRSTSMHLHGARKAPDELSVSNGSASSIPKINGSLCHGRPN